jgi:SLT domain-containing protein
MGLAGGSNPFAHQNTGGTPSPPSTGNPNGGSGGGGDGSGHGTPQLSGGSTPWHKTTGAKIAGGTALAAGAYYQGRMEDISSSDLFFTQQGQMTSGAGGYNRGAKNNARSAVFGSSGISGYQSVGDALAGSQNILGTLGGTTAAGSRGMGALRDAGNMASLNPDAGLTGSASVTSNLLDPTVSNRLRMVGAGSTYGPGGTVRSQGDTFEALLKRGGLQNMDAKGIQENLAQGSQFRYSLQSAGLNGDSIAQFGQYATARSNLGNNAGDAQRAITAASAMQSGKKVSSADAALVKKAGLEDSIRASQNKTGSASANATITAGQAGEGGIKTGFDALAGATTSLTTAFSALNSTLGGLAGGAAGLLGSAGSPVGGAIKSLGGIGGAAYSLSMVRSALPGMSKGASGVGGRVENALSSTKGTRALGVLGSLNATPVYVVNMGAGGMGGMGGEGFGGGGGGGNTLGPVQGPARPPGKFAGVGAAAGKVGVGALGAAAVWSGTSSMRNNADGSTNTLTGIASGVGSGALLGGSIGSVIPGVGTAIGAAVGAAAGGAYAGASSFANNADKSKADKNSALNTLVSQYDALVNTWNNSGYNTIPEARDFYNKSIQTAYGFRTDTSKVPQLQQVVNDIKSRMLKYGPQLNSLNNAKNSHAFATNVTSGPSASNASPTHLAMGGVVPGDHPHDNQLISATPGEVVVPKGVVARHGGSDSLMSKLGFKGKGGKSGHYAEGGAVTWPSMFAAVKAQFPWALDNSDVRNGDPGYHGKGEALDVGAAGNDPAKLMEVDKWIGKNYPDSQELIHLGGTNIKNGKDVGDGFSLYGATTMNEHGNHVHWARTSAPGAPTSSGATAPGATASNQGATPAASAAPTVGQLLIGPAGGNGILSDEKTAFSSITGNSTALGGGSMRTAAGVTAAASAKSAPANPGAPGSSKAGAPPSSASIPPGDPVGRWAPMVAQVLTELHLNPSLSGKVLAQIKTESSGNPGAVQGNIGDVNNASGDLAKGLMQVIGTTFGAWAGPYKSLGQLDPKASIYAGVNYDAHKFGGNPDLSDLGLGHGYETGSWETKNETAKIHQGEMVVPKGPASVIRRAVLDSKRAGLEHTPASSFSSTTNASGGKGGVTISIANITLGGSATSADANALVQHLQRAVENNNVLMSIGSN